MTLDEPWSLRVPHRIRWSECDLYGHVNNAAYLTLFEDLRVAHWEALSGAPISPSVPGPVVASLDARFLKAAGFGDEVLLTCRPVSFRRTSFIHAYALWKDGEACCIGHAVCVVTRQDTGEKVPLSDAIRARLLSEGARAE
jgi:acyl-CoA thioester hydrolase